MLHLIRTWPKGLLGLRGRRFLFYQPLGKQDEVCCCFAGLRAFIRKGAGANIEQRKVSERLALNQPIFTFSISISRAEHVVFVMPTQGTTPSRIQGAEQINPLAYKRTNPQLQTLSTNKLNNLSANRPNNS